MRFLCLPGGYNNAKTFEAQLKPLSAILESDNTASFLFTQGSIPVTVPCDYNGFFGPAPNYSFLDTNDEAIINDNLRHFPRRETPEATVRSVLHQAGWPTYKNTQAVLDHLIDILDQEGDLEGIVGYSQGARVAAALVMEETIRQRKTGRTPRIKCALFLSGWQPVHPTLGEVFADETDERIGIPTCHVMGSSDPFVDGAMALYNLCDHDCADLFDHGAGHVLPRDKEFVLELTDVVRNMINDARGSG